MVSDHNIRARSDARRPFVITFSGIDGAGKTTQIEYLSSWLREQGLRVLRLSFWDHVAAWSKLRAGVGDRTIDSGHTARMAERSFTEPPFAGPSVAPKNNKHIRKWYLTAARWGFYVLDVSRLHRLLGGPLVRDCDVVIFDRYVYDQIANVYSHHSHVTGIFSRTLLTWSPAPDLGFVIDASPDAAFARKPEFPLEFVRENRQTFLLLKELAPRLIIIPEGDEQDVRKKILFHIRRSRLAERTSPEGKTGVALRSTVLRQHSSCRVENDPTAKIYMTSKPHALPENEALDDPWSWRK